MALNLGNALICVQCKVDGKLLVIAGTICCVKRIREGTVERLVAELCIHTREGVLSGVQEAVICRVQITVRIGTAKLYAVFDRDGFLCFPSGDIHVQIGDSNDFSGMSVRAGSA